MELTDREVIKCNNTRTDNVMNTDVTKHVAIKHNLINNVITTQNNKVIKLV